MAPLHWLLIVYYKIGLHVALFITFLLCWITWASGTLTTDVTNPAAWGVLIAAFVSLVTGYWKRKTDAEERELKKLEIEQRIEGKLILELQTQLQHLAERYDDRLRTVEATLIAGQTETRREMTDTVARGIDHATDKAAHSGLIKAMAEELHSDPPRRLAEAPTVLTKELGEFLNKPPTDPAIRKLAEEHAREADPSPGEL